jgi:hypothetical protein
MIVGVLNEQGVNVGSESHPKNDVDVIVAPAPGTV